MLFALTQGHVGLVSGQMLPAVGEKPILSLRALVLPLHGLGNRGTAMGNNDTDRLLFPELSLHLSCQCLSVLNGVSNLSRARWENAGCYKHAAVAYGRIKLQHQSKGKALSSRMSCPAPRKGWGESKVMLKHPPTNEAPRAPSPLPLEPGWGG